MDQLLPLFLLVMDKLWYVFSIGRSHDRRVRALTPSGVNKQRQLLALLDTATCRRLQIEFSLAGDST